MFLWIICIGIPLNMFQCRFLDATLYPLNHRSPGMGLGSAVHVAGLLYDPHTTDLSNPSFSDEETEVKNKWLGLDHSTSQ